MNEINWDEVVDYVQRTGNSEIWPKLTEDERVLYLQALEKWSAGREANRPDNSLFGMPPELIAAGFAGKFGGMLQPKPTPKLSQKTATEAVKAGEGPSGGARGARITPTPGRPVSFQSREAISEQIKRDRVGRMPEHAPGTSNRTSPARHETAMRNLAEEQYDDPQAIAQIRSLLQAMMGK